MPRRRGLDLWFGTGVRYVGLALLLYAVLVDRLRNTALLPTATGLIFFKTVVGGGNGGGG